jgi:hypothetical protein
VTDPWPSTRPHSAIVAHARPARGAHPDMVTTRSAIGVARLLPMARLMRFGKLAGSSWGRARGKRPTWWEGLEEGGSGLACTAHDTAAVPRCDTHAAGAGEPGG